MSLFPLIDQELFRKIHVCDRTGGLLVIVDNRLAVTWTFTEPDVSGDDRFKELIFKMVFDFGSDLVGEPISLVKHGQDQALNV